MNELIHRLEQMTASTQNTPEYQEKLDALEAYLGRVSDAVSADFSDGLFAAVVALDDVGRAEGFRRGYRACLQLCLEALRA